MVSLPEERTVYVANFSDKVDEEILEELFVQTGPVVKVILREVKDSKARFALVEFEDEASVLYAIELLNGVKLYDKEIQVKPRNKTKQEELYRRKRGEIEERVRASQGTDRDRGRRSYDGGRRSTDSRDRSPHRDSWDRNSRDRRSGGSSSSGGRDSWQNHQSSQQRHSSSSYHGRQGGGQYDNHFSLPPPPPPPPMMPLMRVDTGGSWRQGPGGAGGGNQYDSAPPQREPLPHDYFVEAQLRLLNQGGHNQYTDFRPNQPPPPPRNSNQYQNHQNRRQDYRGSDRQGANHYDQRRRF